MIKCPDCDGKGFKLAYVCCGLQSGMRDVNCFTCDGNKEVPDDFEERRKRGKELRNTRVGRGESLRGAAKRMGISATELSKIELGKK